MKKPFWIPLLSAFGTMIVLYAAGYFFNIGLLQLYVSFTYTEISFLPIAAGIAVGFLSEFVIRRRLKAQSA